MTFTQSFIFSFQILVNLTWKGYKYFIWMKHTDDILGIFKWYHHSNSNLINLNSYKCFSITYTCLNSHYNKGMPCFNLHQMFFIMTMNEITMHYRNALWNNIRAICENIQKLFMSYWYQSILSISIVPLWSIRIFILISLFFTKRNKCSLFSKLSKVTHWGRLIQGADFVAMVFQYLHSV